MALIAQIVVIKPKWDCAAKESLRSENKQFKMILCVLSSVYFHIFECRREIMMTQKKKTSAHTQSRWIGNIQVNKEYKVVQHIIRFTQLFCQIFLESSAIFFLFVLNSDIRAPTERISTLNIMKSDCFCGIIFKIWKDLSESSFPFSHLFIISFECWENP